MATHPKLDADTAIDQIHRKEYPAKVLPYTDRLLLVGINYDRKTKLHNCKIERVNYCRVSLSGVPQAVSVRSAGC